MVENSIKILLILQVLLSVLFIRLDLWRLGKLVQDFVEFSEVERVYTFRLV